MKLDVMVSCATWERTAGLARSFEDAGFEGLAFTETQSAPWASIAVAARATRTIELATEIAVAFARSPMVTAAVAWELAGNTLGRFRLGLGSQVRAHVERRYGAPFEPPGPRLRDYVLAVKACFDAFRGTSPLDYHGRYYELTLLPAAWAPPRHAYGDVKIEVAAVNPWMCSMAASVADGICVHPLHSPAYLRQRLLPAVAEGAAAGGKRASDVELAIPVFAAPGDTPEVRAPLVERAREQIAFYGSTRNYAFQFDDIGFEGTSALLAERLRAGDLVAMREVVTDEILSHFAVIGSWDEVAETLAARYRGIATRLVMYLAQESVEADPSALGRWGEIARALAAL